MIFKAHSGLAGILIFIGILIFGIWSCCKEKPPGIDMTPVDTTLIDITYSIDPSTIVPQEKKVLIEDLTGTECPNCPLAHEKVDSIIHEYPQRVFSFSNFRRTFTTKDPDLWIWDGQDIVTDINSQEGGLPMISLDRNEYEGVVFAKAHMYKLPLIVPARLNINSPLNIEYDQKTFDSQNREVQFIIKISFHETVQADRFLSLAVIEDSIESYQDFYDDHPLYPSIEDYMQRNVLRGFITNYLGVKLNAELTAGTVFEKEFKYMINENWDEKKCYLVAFVHQVTDSFDIDQVNQIPVIDN